MEELKRFFQKSDTLSRLILANIIVFAVLRITGVMFTLFNSNDGLVAVFINYLAVPAAVGKLVMQPWSLFTYMFVHYDFFHILFNMLWLYWFGQILTEYLGSKKLWATYVLGGLAGAVLYIIAFNTIPVFARQADVSFAIGASAGILAVVVATATLLPDYKIGIMFIGPVSLKYVAVFSVLLDLINLTDGNAGGHVAHMGGALYGFLYIRQLRKGNDWSTWFIRFTDFLKRTFAGPNLKVAYKDTSTTKRRPVSDDQFNAQKKARQEIIDRILDKISKSGYESLSKEEKEILFRASKE